MPLDLFIISVLWFMLFGYVIVGAIHSGAGFFRLYSDWSGEVPPLYAAIQRYSSPFWIIYGMIGLVIPVLLAISEGDFFTIQNGRLTLLLNDLLTSPFSWSVILLAVVSILFISASFLTYYARRIKDVRAEAMLRVYTLMWSLPAILASVIVFFMLKLHNRLHFIDMLTVMWVFPLSFLAFLVAVYLVYKKKAYGVSFFLITIQYGLAFFGYAVSHYPYVLYPYVTVYDGKISPSFILTTLCVGALFLLLPVLYAARQLFLFHHKCTRSQH